MASLLGINALHASEATAVRIEDYADTLRGHHVIRLSASATTSPRPRRRGAPLRDSFASGPLWRSRLPQALLPPPRGAEHGVGRVVTGMARHVAEVLRVGDVTRAREAWPDTLRVVIIAGVIVMHAATGYVVDVGWYYEERTSSEAWQIALTVPAFLGGLFALGPLFFVAGWLSAPSLARKGPRDFAAGRLLRLGVPLVVFTYLIDPVADYVGDHGEGRPGSLLDYLANAPAHATQGRSGSSP